jgi:hypothetical protein
VYSPRGGETETKWRRKIRSDNDGSTAKLSFSVFEDTIADSKGVWL